MFAAPLGRRFVRTMQSVAHSQKHKVQTTIEQKLTDSFRPDYLQIINESHKHSVPKDSETHFKVVVVSERFDSARTPVDRHRMVNQCLADELDGPVHALSIVAMTPAQWKTKLEHLEKTGETTYQPEPSPNCRGGDGSLPPKK